MQTACSTSLVAVHLACQAILAGECDMALAGAATVRVPQRVGYASVQGGILSPDGHCRAFDADAQGTIFGSGVGAVLLKDLAAAVADGNNIYAVIKGSAINNDGAEKVELHGLERRGPGARRWSRPCRWPTSRRTTSVMWSATEPAPSSAIRSRSRH